MNILFFILPKDKVHYVFENFTLRQVLEKMEYCGYTSLPIINHSGKYIATITEGDILRFIKSKNDLSLKGSEKVVDTTSALQAQVDKIIEYRESKGRINSREELVKNNTRIKR